MSVQIEKGIPIPDEVSTSRGADYPWRDMEVGDSFVARTTNKNTIRPMVSRANKELAPRRFVWAEHEGKLRVWRTE